MSVIAPQLRVGLTQLRARYLPALQQMRQLLQQAQSQGQPPNPALLERYRRLLYHYRSRLQGRIDFTDADPMHFPFATGF